MNNLRSSIFQKIDYILLILVSFLVIAGVAAVYSATFDKTAAVHLYFQKQLTFAFMGIFLMLTIAFIPFKIIQRLSTPFYLLAIFLLILVFFFGSKGFGAERWLSFMGIKIQPSELAKIAAVMLIANYLSKPDIDINRLKTFASFALIIFIPFALIVRQPDLGTSLVFLALAIPILFWVGLNWFYIFLILAPAFTFVLSFNLYAFLIWMLIIVGILFFSQRKLYLLISIFIVHIFIGLTTPEVWAQLRPYQKQRILTFTNPELDPKGTGYQIIQSKVAIGSGGVWGKGYLNGTQSQLKFLPAQHTDFIFSVIGEETGLFGVGIVLFLFFLLLMYLLYLASVVKSRFSQIVLIGITTILFFHIFVNIGMTVGLAPVTGLPLPFISYGGSFLLVVMTMMGLALNFSMNRYEK
jgi:rod shape determining protein RodA